MCFSRKKSTVKFIVNDGAACSRFYIFWLQAASKGTLTDKKLQQTLVINLSCITAEYTSSSYF